MSNEPKKPNERLDKIVKSLSRKVYLNLNGLFSVNASYHRLERDILNQNEKRIMGILNKVIDYNVILEREKNKLADIYQFLEELKLLLEKENE